MRRTFAAEEHTAFQRPMDTIIMVMAMAMAMTAMILMVGVVMATMVLWWW